MVQSCDRCVSEVQICYDEFDASYLLVWRDHGIPTTDTLGADSALSNLWSEVIGNDGTRSLHVQEVRGERSLGRIGVVDALLLLLLGLDSRRLGEAGCTKTLESIGVEKRVVVEA